MADRTGSAPDIETILREHVLVERALEKAARQAIAEHEAEGLPLAVWRHGAVEWVAAEELEDELDCDAGAARAHEDGPHT